MPSPPREGSIIYMLMFGEIFFFSKLFGSTFRTFFNMCGLVLLGRVSWYQHNDTALLG